jgi:hypothetical protein
VRKNPGTQPPDPHAVRKITKPAITHTRQPRQRYNVTRIIRPVLPVAIVPKKMRMARNTVPGAFVVRDAAPPAVNAQQLQLQKREPTRCPRRIRRCIITVHQRRPVGNRLISGNSQRPVNRRLPLRRRQL